MQFLMMGTADKIPEAPIEKPKFIEDMSDNELTTALDLPSGLANLGNTCYLNATVQCLKTIPELREAIQKYVLLMFEIQLLKIFLIYFAHHLPYHINFCSFLEF